MKKITPLLLGITIIGLAAISCSEDEGCRCTGRFGDRTAYEFNGDYYTINNVDCGTGEPAASIINEDNIVFQSYLGCDD